MSKDAVDGLWAKLEKDLAASPFAASLRNLAGARARFLSGRPLNDGERLRLEGQGNSCADWSRVRIASDAGLDTIRHNAFAGDVLLSGFRGEWPGPGGRLWPAGISHCRVYDAIIGDACLHHIARLERQVIEDGAVIVGVGALTCDAPTLFSLGLAIHPGAETATRTAWLWDAVTLDDCAAATALTREDQRDFQSRLDRFLAPLRCAFGYVGRGASVQNARRLQAAWVGPGSVISGASLIRESALLSAEGEAVTVGEDGWVEHALLQPGARAESAGKVSRSILLEHAEVSFGGMVIESVIGPNTHVAKGEITASLVGPFVGFHHQSLLISALWPEGIGNIAYGANVGSNHTGKKPDQEIRPGEGVFFGLGCTIKFPANFADSPYSLIAAGVATLPQRLGFPFSLINQPQAGVPASGPALNEIIPGWMWSDNAYALVRRSYKILDSDKSRRHDSPVHPGTALSPGFFTGRLFAPALARKVLRAYTSLRTLGDKVPADSTRSVPAAKAFFTEEDIPGLGRNYLRGGKLAAAAAAYEDFLTFFLFRTFADLPPSAWSAEVKEIVASITSALAVRGDLPAWLAGRLDRLHGFKDALLKSLLRDDKRGRQIFDDYADFHDAPADDPVLARLDKEVKAMLLRLDPVLKGAAAPAAPSVDRT